MRSHAKLLQKEVNSLLAEINFNIFENIILPKRSTLVLGIQIKRRMLLYIGQALRKMDRQFKLALWKTGHQIRPVQWKTDQLKETFITLDSLKLWRPMRTFWKAYQVFFSMAQVPSVLDFPMLRYEQISENCSEDQQSSWDRMLGPCKTVPIYKVSWCMLHMAGKLFESTFTPNKWFIIWRLCWSLRGFGASLPIAWSHPTFVGIKLVILLFAASYIWFVTYCREDRATL
jgi:hypothetical protein